MVQVVEHLPTMARPWEKSSKYDNKSMGFGSLNLLYGFNVLQFISFLIYV
jgi:hypothetical protein